MQSSPAALQWAARVLWPRGDTDEIHLYSVLARHWYRHNGIDFA
jgi:hypothetical protein